MKKFTRPGLNGRIMLGASVWFVLTGPLKAYLEAAEPPEPNEGDRMYNGVFHFG